MQAKKREETGKMLSLALVLSVAVSCGAFNPSYSAGKIATKPTLQLIRHAGIGDQEHTTILASSSGNQQPTLSSGIRLEAYASSGIQSKSELPRVLEAVASVCEENGVPLDISNIQSSELPSRPNSLPGVLGRVLLISIHGVPSDFDVDENELMTQLKIESSQRIDEVLYQEEEGGSNQPVLLAFRPDGDGTTLDKVIEREVSDYGLRDGLDVNNEDDQKEDDANFIPSLHIEIDGAMIESIDSSPGQTHFDTSSVLVFDNILDDSLRQRLLHVVKGNAENSYGGSFLWEKEKWNDVENGPDPDRWIRGGLLDVVVDEKSSNDDDNNDEGPCWGLKDEAIMDICYNDHPAIAKFESKLAQLFPDFIVTRLPEAVLGGCVSPLTANAPTHGDTFEYHIDADPLQVPPSPWADVFGKYPNRSKSKPRFVSCLVYLNDEWDSESWGAPTQFLDPPTQQTYEVFPQPGRCVFMDQDISHTVVAPNAEAGKLPRYSLVWKLILHPKLEGQDMDLSCGRKNLWPEPIVVGSANMRDDS